jgi:ABC-type antimicrobial peptide transport system permease subunit
MFKNHFKTAWRNIIRNKVHTVINVAGLALGLTCCMFIYLWVQDEKSVDNFNTNGKNLYAVYTSTIANGKTDGTYATPMRFDSGNISPDFLLEGVPSAVPEVKHLTFYATGYELPWGHPETFRVGEKIIKMKGSRAGKDFFKMFSYPLIEGNASNALADMHGIAISRKMAEIFFGSPANAMGKSMRYENRLNFIVTAVFENVPEQSSLHFDFLLNMDAQKHLLEWASPNLLAYVELANNSNPEKIETEINSYLKPLLAKEGNIKTTIGLQLLGKQYLHNLFVNGKPTAGRIEYIRIFNLIAIFILIIACINFMNLATARSVKRAKEIGLRKVVGSKRSNLIGQFFGEALLFAFLAMLFSICLLYLLLPAFNSFTGKHIASPGPQPSFWIFLITIVFITGLLSGSYPALYLSSLNPVSVLKGKLQFTQNSVLFRKGLTVFQFVLSIVLIISTIVITRQMNYIQSSHLGFDRENLLYVQIEGKLSEKQNYLLFKNKALQMPGIAMVDRSTETPHDMNFVAGNDAINWEGKTINDHVGFLPASVGFDFLKLMKLQVAEGRGFSKDIATDSSDAFIVNEEAVKEMGLKNPIGKWISAWKKKGHIIGVLKDYNTQSIREKIKPVVLDVKEGEYFGVIMIRTKPGETKKAIASLGKIYKSINPDYAFAYQFVEEEYQKLYSNEIIISRLSVLFAALAIFISCLGLLGLAMFSAEQRVKEIGIRKVLGASVNQVVTLFSTEFIKLVLIAFLIAAPVAWYFMNNWLQGFAYKVNISWWMFFMAGAIAVLIALITVSFQAIKAAMSNPVKSLRSE